MNQAERRLYLIQYLLREQIRYRKPQIPADSEGQQRLLRSLMNVHMPDPISAAQIAVQTVREFLDQDSRIEKVIFNVFKQEDDAIYHELLG